MAYTAVTCLTLGPAHDNFQSCGCRKLGYPRGNLHFSVGDRYLPTQFEDIQPYSGSKLLNLQIQVTAYVIKLWGCKHLGWVFPFM